ncbi:hypothetical protein QQP08_024478 [Theobroma cacao]|nr:hypothetical protein QQP08_024478 [Theobroma cacao]
MFINLLKIIETDWNLNCQYNLSSCGQWKFSQMRALALRSQNYWLMFNERLIPICLFHLTPQPFARDHAMLVGN